MNSILVGFSKPKMKFPILSWMIRLLENTKYSHVYIKWESDWLQRDIVYEASGMMVHFKEGTAFEEHAETVHLFDVECGLESKKKIIQKCMDYSGNPYGLKQLFGILIVKILRIFGKDIENPFADGNKTWVCSEIVSELLEELEITFPVNQDNITPKDIFNGLSKIERVKKLI